MSDIGVTSMLRQRHVTLTSTSSTYGVDCNDTNWIVISWVPHIYGSLVDCSDGE